MGNNSPFSIINSPLPKVLLVSIVKTSKGIVHD